ncbi:hypothetical protein OEA41_002778 [Lepraria neglecta]|uniref:Uncharacterized protein n=1 Tax=Lepraria neglecta TaxID=209136 RepID=A0AAE0DIE8_9LECA|nr:hypothetical protein OEA41_002778 [Lepraria neglecta]
MSGSELPNLGTSNPDPAVSQQLTTFDPSSSYTLKFVFGYDVTNDLSCCCLVTASLGRRTLRTFRPADQGSPSANGDQTSAQHIIPTSSTEMMLFPFHCTGMDKSALYEIDLTTETNCPDDDGGDSADEPEPE